MDEANSPPWLLCRRCRSPEVAAMSLAVFGVHETARLGFVKAAIRSIAIAAVSLLGLAVAHHAIYGVWIQPDVFLEYVVHVPTPWPINPISDFMFLACALGLGAWNVFRPPMDALALRRVSGGNHAPVRRRELLSRPKPSEQCL